jgi:hypothetical protein
MPVVDVACGRDSTVAVTAFRRDPSMLEQHYRRAVAADPANAETLRLFPAYSAMFERIGSDYRDDATRAREAAARKPPSPRTMRRLRNSELLRLQRERQARREEAVMESADDAARRQRGRMAKRDARRAAAAEAAAEAAAQSAAAGETVALWDMPDAEGPKEWRRQAVRAARELLEAEDCMRPPEATGCPLCFRGNKCASCRFHARWVVPFASRQYGRVLQDKQRRQAEVAARRKAAFDSAAASGADLDKVLVELERQERAQETAAQSAEASTIPAYRQWPLRDLVEVVLTENRHAAGEVSDDSELDDVARPVAITAATAESSLARSAKKVAQTPLQG